MEGKNLDNTKKALLHIRRAKHNVSTLENILYIDALKQISKIKNINNIHSIDIVKFGINENIEFIHPDASVYEELETYETTSDKLLPLSENPLRNKMQRSKRALFTTLKLTYTDNSVEEMVLEHPIEYLDEIPVSIIKAYVE